MCGLSKRGNFQEGMLKFEKIKKKHLNEMKINFGFEMNICCSGEARPPEND